MKVLVACEFSGIVRDAFTKQGHFAVSCDLLPTERPGNHILGDVFQIPYLQTFDLMIAHPPCTYLCCAGFHYSKRDPKRMKKTLLALKFFMGLYNTQIDKICIENPAGYISTAFRKPDQIIDPFEFGEQERKKTCLWLKGLPPLFLTGQMEKPKPQKTIIRKTGKQAGKKYNYYWRQGKSAHDRSRTFQGIADAMAEQWG